MVRPEHALSVTGTPLCSVMAAGELHSCAPAESVVDQVLSEAHPCPTQNDTKTAALHGQESASPSATHPSPCGGTRWRPEA